MKKKIIMSAMSVLTSCMLIGGATYATFTDSATNASNVFKTGTVDIDSYRDGFDTIPGPMFYTTPQEGATPTNPSFDGLKPTGIWAPGDTHIRSLIVYNKGSLDTVLDQVKAEIESDPENMASQMEVAVYKILPRYLANGTPFAPIPGDDTLDQAALDQASRTFNPFIISAWAFGVEELAQNLIENQIPVTAEKLWNGNLGDLTSAYQNFDAGKEISLKSKSEIPFAKRGCLLAFVVHMKRDAGNQYQGAEAKFGFTVNAHSN